jgi:hypothetical protein
VPRKRGAPRRPQRPATPRNDPYLLDEFSHQDLNTWKRNSALLQEYRIKQFYELESLRELHRDELIQALRDQGDCREKLAGWMDPNRRLQILSGATIGERKPAQGRTL